MVIRLAISGTARLAVERIVAQPDRMMEAGMLSVCPPQFDRSSILGDVRFRQHDVDLLANTIVAPSPRLMHNSNYHFASIGHKTFMTTSRVGTMPPLDWLRTFEAAARLSNFTAAAGELGLTQAAVSQHVRSLEDRLKRPLFIRLARGVELTPEGAAYLPHLQSAFAMIGNTTRELFEPKAIQSVTIRSPISFAVLMIAPILPEMARSLPSIQLRIETIHTPTDYAERPTCSTSDLATARLPAGRLIASPARR
jgi:DNA-binding MarR family transcriptional regulator